MADQPDTTTSADAALLARLDAALRSLSRTDRELFLAHRLDAMSYADMAEATGRSVAEITRRMARAITAIDRAMSRSEH